LKVPYLYPPQNFFLFKIIPTNPFFSQELFNKFSFLKCPPKFEPDGKINRQITYQRRGSLHPQQAKKWANQFLASAHNVEKLQR